MEYPPNQKSGPYCSISFWAMPHHNLSTHARVDEAPWEPRAGWLHVICCLMQHTENMGFIMSSPPTCLSSTCQSGSRLKLLWHSSITRADRLMLTIRARWGSDRICSTAPLSIQIETLLIARLFFLPGIQMWKIWTLTIDSISNLWNKQYRGSTLFIGNCNNP